MAAHLTPRFDAFRITLALVLAGLSIWAAILPVSRFDWFLENLLVWIAVVIIARLGNPMKISRAAYVLLALFLALQIYGSHYAYRPAIGTWISVVFDSPRNSFDRFMHLCFGILLFIPITECYQNALNLSRKTAMFCSLVAITALGAVYEVIEWGMMIVLIPQAGAEFVGAQGDPWDAQKDMALAMAGSSIAAFAIAIAWRRKEEVNNVGAK